MSISHKFNISLGSIARPVAKSLAHTRLIEARAGGTRSLGSDLGSKNGPSSPEDLRYFKEGLQLQQIMGYLLPAAWGRSQAVSEAGLRAGEIYRIRLPDPPGG